MTMPCPTKGFFVVPLWYYSKELENLSAPEREILLFIIRRTLGFHKLTDTIALSQFEHGVGKERGVGYSRPTIIKALKNLVALTYVETGTGRSRNVSTYKLRDDLATPLLAPTNATKAQPAVKSPAPRVKSTPSHAVKPIDPQNEILSKHVDASSKHVDLPQNLRSDDDVSSARIETRPGLEPYSETKLPINGELFPSSGTEDRIDAPPIAATQFPSRLPEPKLPTYCEPLAVDPPSQGLDILLERLMAIPIGYSRRSALQILERYSVERIEAGLDNLRVRKDVRNPAGYLLRELQAGDYAPPLIQSGAPRRTLLYALPRNPDGTGNSGAPSVDNEAEVRLQAAIAALDPVTRSTLMLEVRTQYARLKHTSVDKIPEDSLWVVSTFEARVQALMEASLAA